MGKKNYVKFFIYVSSISLHLGLILIFSLVWMIELLGMVKDGILWTRIVLYIFFFILSLGVS